jgi:hypothetical protein
LSPEKATGVAFASKHTDGPADASANGRRRVVEATTKIKKK